MRKVCLNPVYATVSKINSNYQNFSGPKKREKYLTQIFETRNKMTVHTKVEHLFKFVLCIICLVHTCDMLYFCQLKYQGRKKRLQGDIDLLF